MLSAVEKYVPMSKLAQITGISKSTLRDRCNAGVYDFIETKGRGGSRYEILISSLDVKTQEQVFNTQLNRGRSLNQQNSLVSNAPVFLNKNKPIITALPDKAKILARAKIDFVLAWEKAQKENGLNHKQFLALYNSGTPYPALFSILGKVSKTTLYRWQREYREERSYKAMIPKYNYASIFHKETKLSEIEKKYFLDLLLQPNKISVGNAFRLVKFVLNKSGISACSEATYRRYADWYKNAHQDQWVLMREGQKALKDKIEPYIKRSPELLEVGDVLIADGHTLDFEVINPFNSKPCRATMVAYLDWASQDFVGYEIMLSENTQCIASALRNAIIRLGKMPKICYQDNGRAFRAKFFRGTKNFEETGFYGLFGNLGIVPVYATPYNARAKIIERSFREFSETFERLLPSYTGNSPINKPAWRMRNEKFHKAIHNEFVPTIDQAVQLIEQWLEFHRAQPCPNKKGKTIGEVFENGRGPGVDLAVLDDFMLAEEKRKIGRNGIKFLNNQYFSEELYGLNDSVTIKYSLFDLTKIKVYSSKGEFLCEASTILKIHPMAEYLGNSKDVYSLKKALKQHKKLERQTIKKCVGYMHSSNNVLTWQNAIETTQKTESIEENRYEFIDDYFEGKNDEPQEHYDFKL